MGLKLKWEGFMTKKRKKSKNPKKFWGFPPKIRFFGFFHFLKLKGHRNRLEEVWGVKIDGCWAICAKSVPSRPKSFFACISLKSSVDYFFLFSSDTAW